jgi:hypothetical protein
VGAFAADRRYHAAMRALVAIAALLASARAARAGDFDALARPGASWSYEVVAGAKHKPTGTKVTYTVSAVHTAGPYTVVELAATPDPSSGDPDLPTLILGPDGVHAAPFFAGGDLPPDQRYALDNVKATYDDHYLPYGTIPTLAKGKKHLKLDRFGDDDCEYDTHVAMTQPKGKPWHVAWTGTCTVPENGERDRVKIAIDFDPAIGITMLCNSDGTCLRLAAP